MNRNQWTSSQNRLSCAGVALLASTLVLSSVVWLFAGAADPIAGAPTAIADTRPASPSAQPVASRLAATSSAVSKL